MRALWKSDLGQGKHDPLEIVSVVTKSGSTISADLVVPLDPVAAPPADDTAGLLEVIETQMAAINELSARLDLDPYVDPDYPALKEWADQFPDLIADLCVALGLPASPVGSTGIPELDIIVSLAR